MTELLWSGQYPQPFQLGVVVFYTWHVQLLRMHDGDLIAALRSAVRTGNGAYIYIY